MRGEIELVMEEKRNNEWILPIKEPIIASYTNDAHIASILGAYNYTQDWLISQYILIYCRKNLKEHCWGNFYFPMTYNVRSQESCRYLQKQKIHTDTIHAMNVDIIEFVCMEIENSNYVDIMLDPYYLRTTYCYHSEHGYHDILIYGFNRDEKKFYCADFLFSKTATYTFSEVSFEDFMKAYEKCDPNAPENYQSGLVYLYKILEKERANYVFDFQNIIHSLRAYYQCKRLENWEFYHSDDANGVAFGLEVYDMMEKYIEDIKECKDEWINIRMFHVMLNHKRIMNERIRYLQVRYPELDELFIPLLEKYIHIQNLCNSLTMKILKSYFAKSKIKLDDINNLLIKVKDLERTALKEFFEVYDARYMNKEIH